MPRRFAGPKLVVATHNRGKAGEIRTLLSPFGVDIVSAGELGLPAPEETGRTFEDNATIKALAPTRASGLPARDAGVEPRGARRAGARRASRARAPRAPTGSSPDCALAGAAGGPSRAL